jgi:hypothetical protein
MWNSGWTTGAGPFDLSFSLRIFLFTTPPRRGSLAPLALAPGEWRMGPGPPLADGLKNRT